MAMQHKISIETVDLLRYAVNVKDINISEFINNPYETAKEFGRDLTVDQVNQLTQLKNIGGNLAKKAQMDLVDVELVDNITKVVNDGRFIEEWMTDPKSVADKLSLTLSKEAEERIKSSKFSDLVDADEEKIVLQIVGIATIMVVYGCPDKGKIQPIIDKSGINKL